MFDRYNDPSGGSYRKTLFGGNGRRMPAVPAMERLSPQAEVPAPGAGSVENAQETPCLEACSLAMVYSPVQEWRGLYSIDEAIRKGTLFSELDKPFRGKTLSGR